MHGGGQERDVRSGTYNVAGIVGFGAAVSDWVEKRAGHAERVRALRDSLQERLLGALDRIRVNGHPVDRLPNNLHVCVKGIDGESLILLLDAAGVAASQGSACASGAAEPSYVLAAMGVPREAAMGALRLTLGPETTDADIDAAASAIIAAVGRLRG
jgi:cysteine desulfurase